VIAGVCATAAVVTGKAVTRARAIELLCEARKWPVRKSLLEVDHKVPLALGGKDDLQNTRVLCLGCHRAKPDLKLIPKAVRKAKRRETFEARMAEKAGR
jgi:5-methylcytosine-specific restriction endonuclease McrA